MKIDSTIKYLLFILLGFSTLITAQQDLDELTKQRDLGDHYFTLSNILRSPFVFTQINTSIGMGGITDLKYPIIVIDETDYKYLQGDLAIVLLSFEYQYAVKDWLAVFLGFEISSRLGSDFPTLFKEGINYATTFNIGWMIKIIRFEKFALSGSIKVNNGSYSIISIENFAEDIQNGNENPSLILDRYSTVGIAGLSASYGMNYFLGFSGEFNLGIGESIEREQKNKVFVNVGVEGDMNFTRLIDIPISCNLGYLYSSSPVTKSALYFDRNIFFGQLNYIDRTDFIISLNLSMSREISQGTQNLTWPKTLTFNMRYLF